MPDVRLISVPLPPSLPPSLAFALPCPHPRPLLVFFYGNKKRHRNTLSLLVAEPFHPMVKARTLEQLRRELKQYMHQRTGWERLYESVNGVAGLISAIIETANEPDTGAWVEHVDGLTEEEKEQFKRVMGPYVPAIRHFALSIRPSQQGGADTDAPSGAAPAASTTAAPAPAASATASPASAAPSGPASAASPLATASAASPLVPALDLDAAFMGLVKKTNEIDQGAEYLASQYGLTRLEREFDTSDDFHIIPEFLRVMIGTLGQGGMALKTFLDKLKVPYRLIVFAIYLYLDITRLTAATMGYPAQQRTATVILALLELFRGDWKKAILTFMGFYGTTPLLAGQLGKVFLYLFERLSPTIQDRMVYGAWDAGKSLLVGLLLSVFQLTAPLSVRKPVMDLLETLSQGKKALDQTLVEAGLEPRSDEFEPTWANINRLQAVNQDPVFICSCEYQEVIKNIGDSTLMKLILQLLGLPVNEEMKEKYTCVGRLPCKPYVEALREEQTPKGAPSAPLAPSAPAASLAPSVPAPPPYTNTAPSAAPTAPSAPSAPAPPPYTNTTPTPSLPQAPLMTMPQLPYMTMPQPSYPTYMPQLPYQPYMTMPQLPPQTYMMYPPQAQAQPPPYQQGGGPRRLSALRAKTPSRKSRKRSLRQRGRE